MKFLKRKRNTKKPQKYSPEAITKMAENQINTKLNKIADFLEEQKDWTLFDVYIIFNLILKNDIENKLTEKQIEQAKQALEIMTISREKDIKEGE